MDERRNQGEGEGKAAWGDEQDRLSGQVARLLNCQDCAWGCIGQPDSGTRVRPGAGSGEDRQAGGQGRVANDSAYGERVLRSADEQCELSRRVSAAAVFQG